MVGHRAAGAFLILTMITVLFGCSTLLRERPGITYARDVEQLGIFPVYPPREDLQVGDIYSVAAHSEADRLEALRAYVGSVDVAPLIRKYLRSRYEFGTTALDQAKTGPTLLQTDAPPGTLMSKARLDALPITAFPSITVNSGLLVSAGGQPAGLLAAFGITAARSLSMNLQFDLVTSYSISIAEAREVLRQYCRENDAVCDSEYLAELIDDRYQLGVGAKDHVSEANLLFVYKVYLARKITYTFTDASVVAAAAATVAKGGAATAKPIQVDAATIQQILATKDAQMISAAAQLLNAQGQSVSSSTTPNSGQFGFAGVRAEGVSFEQTFARPVVIGYEAISRHGDYVFGSAMTPSPGGGIPLGGAPVLTPTQ